MDEAESEIEQLLSERNAALLSLDEKKIRQYAARYGIGMPKDSVAFWAGIHKARCQWTECPAEARSASEIWLADHNMTTGASAATTKDQ